MIKWKYPAKGELPESDPYKRYLVVYTPHEYANGHYGYDTFHTRFDVANYYPGTTYHDTPWHFDCCYSAKTESIIAWADIGDAKDFNVLFRKTETGETILDADKIPMYSEFIKN